MGENMPREGCCPWDPAAGKKGGSRRDELPMARPARGKFGGRRTTDAGGAVNGGGKCQNVDIAKKAADTGLSMEGKYMTWGCY